METFIIKTDNAWKSLPQNISAGYVLYWYSHLLLCKFCVDKVTVPMHIGIWGRGLQLPLPKSFRLLKFFPAVIKIRTDVVCCIHVSTILSNQSVNHHHSSVITKFNFNLQRSLRRRSWWGGSRCPSHKTHPHSMISPSSFDTQPFGPQYSSFLGEKLPQPSKNIGPVRLCLCIPVGDKQTFMLADDFLKPKSANICRWAQLLLADTVCFLQVVQHVFNVMCHASWCWAFVCRSSLSRVHVRLQTIATSSWESYIYVITFVLLHANHKRFRSQLPMWTVISNTDAIIELTWNKVFWLDVSVQHKTGHEQKELLWYIGYGIVGFNVPIDTL